MVNPFRYAKQKLDAKYHKWLDRRLPYTSEIQLNQKRIFIFPNKVGWLFITMLILLFVTGINYQNNLILTVGFLLVSVFITSIVSTYQNLSALIIKAVAADPVFAGETVNLPIKLENPNKQAKIGLMLGFKEHQALIEQVSKSEQVKIRYSNTSRGILSVPKIKLFSVYPLGFLTCWTWLRLDFKGLVYPKPVDKPFIKATGVGEDEEGASIVQNGFDEFEGLRKYQKGDSLKRVAWKQYAKTQQLLTKEYHDNKGDDRTLDWYSLSGFSTEERLQILCGWVLKAHDDKSDYGLKLPNQTIQINSGEQHKQICLTALALYPEVTSHGV